MTTSPRPTSGPHVTNLITRTRDGSTLTDGEITGLVAGYVHGTVPPAQMAAWLMAVTCRGLTDDETHALTQALAADGEFLNLRADVPGVIDKHSTGGVGDTTTLVAVPLAAAAGVPVAKMSGGSLGFAGGTLDKLRAFSGINLNLDRQAFLHHLTQAGIALSSASPRLAPGDKAIYALRNITGTVESLPLIAASVMSKKLATGATAVVLNVTTGGGSFTPALSDARELARLLAAIGDRAGLPTRVILSDMSQPLGYAIGNALEVKEAIQALSGQPIPGLTDLAVTLATHMVSLSRNDPDHTTITHELRNLLTTGQALQTFRGWITSQGADPRQIDDPTRLPTADQITPVVASSTGWISRIDARELGALTSHLTATARRGGHSAPGIHLHCRVGDPITAGQALADLHTVAATTQTLDTSTQRTHDAFAISPTRPPDLPVVHEIV